MDFIYGNKYRIETGAYYNNNCKVQQLGRSSLFCYHKTISQIDYKIENEKNIHSNPYRTIIQQSSMNS